MKKIRRLISLFALLLILGESIVSSEAIASVGGYKAKKTKIKKEIEAVGLYSNWDGVTNVSQFKYSDDEFCFAYDDGKYVRVVRTKKDVPLKKIIKLKKKSSIFGAVTCDKEGYYYVVTGKKNLTNNTDVKTVFISKYDSKGKFISSIGNNGSSSTFDYETKIPFDGGNCDVAVNGDYLAVNYAREMYSGHQSDALFLINKKKMKKVQVDDYYHSHSFAQRVVPYGDDFILANEGDCYDRAFSISTVDVMTGDCFSRNIFDFWVKKGTLDRWDMHTLNNNFAHMGGIATSKNNNVAFVGTSVKALNSKATKQTEQLFIQIFDPDKDLRKASGYVTTGVRSGYSGPNGDIKVKNYGVKWLTNFSKKYKIKNSQVIATDDGRYVVLFEKEKNYNYQGIYCIILDSTGKIQTKMTKISSSAHLNHAEMPIYIKGNIYWVSNIESDKDINIYIHRFKV